MSTQDLYSKRNKKSSGNFEYDVLPDKLKIQIVHIWNNFFKQVTDDFRTMVWKTVHSMLCEEHGKKTLFEDSFAFSNKNSQKVEKYFEANSDLEESLDVIETIFRVIEKTPEVLDKNYQRLEGHYPAEEAVKDLNTRFFENNVGYQYQNKRIIRVDNTILHKEIIVETFQNLLPATFQNANEEFLSAQVHFREKRNKECVADCLKALETTIKIICEENKWQYKKTDTASKLIDACFKNNLIPEYLQNHFAGLKSTLESGVPTVRNKLGGHGQGVEKIIVPDHFASYMLYLTGTTINFLVACHNELKPKS